MVLGDWLLPAHVVCSCDGDDMRDIDNYEKFIKECLFIDNESPTGLTWKGHPNKTQATKLTGSAAGSDNGRGYYRTKVKDKLLRNHRIVFFLHHGCWPAGEIDHIDGDKGNNHPGNLRVTNRSENCQNNLAKGYSWNERAKKWQAAIRVDGKPYYLGYFSSEEAAHDAYLNAKKKLHPSAPERCYE